MRRPAPKHIRLLTLGLVAASLTACADRPILEPVTTERPDLAGAPGGYPVVILRPSGGPPSEAGAPVVNSVADAVARVKAGGTIRVHPGTYAASDVMVDRPLTFEATGSGVVIESPAGVDGAFVVRGITDGTATFRDITFVSSSYSAIAAFGTYDHVVVEGSAFHVGGVTGIYAGRSPIAGALVQVHGSSFRGGQVGVFAPGAHIDVFDSSFDQHSFGGIQLQSTSATGRIQGNSLTNCGQWGCIRVLHGQNIEVLGNSMSNTMGRRVNAGIFVSAAGADVFDNEIVGIGGDAFGAGIRALAAEVTVRGNRIGGARDGIALWNGTSGVAEGNTVAPCGEWSCINVDARSTTRMLVTGNELRSSVAHRSFFGIVVGAPAGAAVAIVGNTLWGDGEPRDRTDWQDSYAFNGAGVQVDPRGTPGATVNVSDNAVHNAHQGIVALDGAVVVGRDNRVSLAHQPLKAWNDGKMYVRFSDITEYQIPLNDGPGSTPDFDATCNWWGSAGGPQGWTPPSVTASDYTPWATAPIAGTGAGSCSGS